MPTVPLAEAAARLGVPESVVLADVVRGTKPTGAIGNLIGQRTPDGCEVEAWELEGERLEMHRGRLRPCS